MADTQTAVKDAKLEAPANVAPVKKEAEVPRKPAVEAKKEGAWYSKWWSGVKTCCGRADPKDLTAAQTAGKTDNKAVVKTTAETDANKTAVADVKKPDTATKDKTTA
jgi:hypothetical protein